MEISVLSDADPSSFPVEILIAQCKERLDRLETRMSFCVNNNPKKCSLIVSAAVAARAALERIPTETYLPVGESTGAALQGACASLLGVLASAIRAVEKQHHRSALVKWVKQGTTHHQLDEIGRQMYLLSQTLWLHSLDFMPDGSTPRHRPLDQATTTDDGVLFAAPSFCTAVDVARCRIFLANKSLASITLTAMDGSSVAGNASSIGGDKPSPPQLLSTFPPHERPLCLLLDQGAFGTCVWSGHAGGSVRVWHQAPTPSGGGGSRARALPFGPRLGNSSQGRQLELRLARGDVTSMGRVAPGLVWVGTSQGCVAVLRARWASPSSSSPSPSSSSPMPSLAAMSAGGGVLPGGAAVAIGVYPAGARADMQAIELVTTLRRVAHAQGKAQHAGGGIAPGLFSAGSSLHAHQGPVTAIVACGGGAGGSRPVVWTCGRLPVPTTADITGSAGRRRADVSSQDNHGYDEGEAACCCWDAETFALLGHVPCDGDGLGMAVCAVVVPGATTARANGPLLASGHAGGGVMLLDGTSRETVAVLLPPGASANAHATLGHGGARDQSERHRGALPHAPLGVSSLSVLASATGDEPLRLCAGHGDGVVRMWRLDAAGGGGTQGAALELAVAAHTCGVRWMACLTPWGGGEGKLLTVSREGVLRVWRVAEEEDGEDGRARLGEGVDHMVSQRPLSMSMVCEQAILVAQDSKGSGLALLGMLDGFAGGLDASLDASYSSTPASRARSYAVDRGKGSFTADSRESSFTCSTSSAGRDSGYLHASNSSSGALGSLFPQGWSLDKLVSGSPDQGSGRDTAACPPGKPPTSSSGAPTPLRVQFASDVAEACSELGTRGGADLPRAWGGSGETTSGALTEDDGARGGMYGRVLSTSSNGGSSNWARATSFGSNASSVRGGWGRLPSSSSFGTSHTSGLSPAGSGVLLDDALARTASQNGACGEELLSATCDNHAHPCQPGDNQVGVAQEPYTSAREAAAHTDAPAIPPGEPRHHPAQRALAPGPVPTCGEPPTASMEAVPPEGPPKATPEEEANGAGNKHGDALNPADALDLRGSRQLVAKFASSALSPPPRVSSLLPWEIDVRQIKMVRSIGGGSYGDVFLAHWRCTEVAVKKVIATPGGSLSSVDATMAAFHKEASLMQMMRHPNVVMFMGACVTPPHLCIVTEYCPRGSLYDVLQRVAAPSPAATGSDSPSPVQLDWPRRLSMALDASIGMNYLHSSRPPIMHRDLKSPNLLVDKHWRVKVADFNLSRLMEASITHVPASSNVHSPRWMAPEMLRGDNYELSADVFSFGVILWELITLQVPWDGMSSWEIMAAVAQREEKLELPTECSPPLPELPQLSELIRQCWGPPRSRPSFPIIAKTLKGLLDASIKRSRKNRSPFKVLPGNTPNTSPADASMPRGPAMSSKETKALAGLESAPVTKLQF